MPAIKLKKAAAEHQAEKEREEREREAEAPSNVAPKQKESKEVKETKEPRESKESKDPGQSNSLLRGLDANILFEKRKRQIMPSEQKVIDWIDTNLEVKENSHVSLQNLYDYFGEACSFDGTPVVAMEIFTKRIFDKFGKFFALKESSPYKGIIKERIGKVKSPKPKGDSTKNKMKEIIEEALKEAGNPAKGVRFHTLKQYIACNYPAYRVDLRPALLKTALNRGITYGYFQLVKGVGLAGLYRLPVDEEPDEEQEESAEDKKAEKTDQQNGDSGEGGEKAEEKKKKKSKKKKEEGETEVKEGETKEGETEEGKEGETEEADKKKKKKRKRKFPRLTVEVYGGAPQKIEDVFPMAMTYMAEPKQASFTNIRKYFREYYPQVDENTLKKAIMRGINKGFWDPLNEKQVFNSRYELLIDEFDPNSNDNVEDMICSAIIACSEPKQASTVLLKKYIIEYHPEFKIDSRPHLYKNALERGIKKGIILQLSGIGASGSFQLCDPYRPSPALLAGDEEVIEIDNYIEEKAELYIPRGTKSRKLAPKQESGETRLPPTKRKPPTERKDRPAKKPAKSTKKSSTKASAKSSKSRSRGRYVEEESEDDEDVIESEGGDEEEEIEDEPKPKKARKPAKASPKKKSTAKSPAKKASKPVSRSQVKDDEEEEEEEEEPETPKKSKKSEEEEVVKSSRGRSKSRPNYTEDKNESDDDEPKASRGRKSSGSKRSSKVVSYEEGEDEDEEMVEYTPRKSKSRGGDAESESSSPKKSKKRR